MRSEMEELENEIERANIDAARAMAAKAVADQEYKLQSARLREGNTFRAQKLMQEMEQTLGMTTSVQVSAICIYSVVAEMFGSGNRHVVGEDPDNHFDQ